MPILNKILSHTSKSIWRRLPKTH